MNNEPMKFFRCKVLENFVTKCGIKSHNSKNMNDYDEHCLLKFPSGSSDNDSQPTINKSVC